MAINHHSSLASLLDIGFRCMQKHLPCCRNWCGINPGVAIPHTSGNHLLIVFIKYFHGWIRKGTAKKYSGTEVSFVKFDRSNSTRMRGNNRFTIGSLLSVWSSRHIWMPMTEQEIHGARRACMVASLPPKYTGLRTALSRYRNSTHKGDAEGPMDVVYSSTDLSAWAVDKGTKMCWRANWFMGASLEGILCVRRKGINLIFTYRTRFVIYVLRAVILLILLLIYIPGTLFFMKILVITFLPKKFTLQSFSNLKKGERERKKSSGSIFITEIGYAG